MSGQDSSKTEWTIFCDLQCPYSRKCYRNQLPELRKTFGGKYNITFSLTSLVFHPQAFTAQCATSYIEQVKGVEARNAFIEACYDRQELFSNAKLGDCRKSDVDKAFATIAEGAGLFDEKMTKEDFLSGLHDWEKAVKPAYTEHKIALAAGAFATPKHLIGGKLMEGTESSWGNEEWKQYLSKQGL